MYNIGNLDYGASYDIDLQFLNNKGLSDNSNNILLDSLTTSTTTSMTSTTTSMTSTTTSMTSTTTSMTSATTSMTSTTSSMTSTTSSLTSTTSTTTSTRITPSNGILSTVSIQSPLNNITTIANIPNVSIITDDFGPNISNYIHDLNITNVSINKNENKKVCYWIYISIGIVFLIILLVFLIIYNKKSSKKIYPQPNSSGYTKPQIRNINNPVYDESYYNSVNRIHTNGIYETSQVGC